MCKAKNRADWNLLSNLMALMININRDPKKRAIQPREIDPYAKEQTKKQEPDFYISPDELDALLTRPQKNKTPPTSSSSLLTPPS